MNFDFNEDQRALADTVQRFVARDYTFENAAPSAIPKPGWSREVWQVLADLGVLAINIDEDYGGLGYGPQETGLVMGAFGAGLLLEPYLAAAVVAPALIRRAASADFQEEWLPNIATGEPSSCWPTPMRATRRSRNSAATSTAARRWSPTAAAPTCCWFPRAAPTATPALFAVTPAPTASACATTRRSTASAPRTSR
jgi:alkylation response protein AidB-like acyl-CoA dehydrogenase